MPEERALTIYADCRIDYRDDLARKLGLDKSELAGLSDEDLVLRSYEHWGSDCVTRLEGDFAFVICDPKKQEIFCARDHFGCRPFFYYEDEQSLVFASTIKDLIKTKGIQLSPDPEGILATYSSRLRAKDRSFCKEIKRLQPAHVLKMKPGESSVSEAFWELDRDPEVVFEEAEQAVSRFRELLGEAIKQRIRNSKEVGLELSGGLDSSALAAFAMDVKKGDTGMHAFSHALSEKQASEYYPFRDESALSTKVAKHMGLDSHTLVTGEDLPGALDAARSSILGTGVPITQLFSPFSDILLDEAGARGVDVLLSGFGGDECVSHPAPKSKFLLSRIKSLMPSGTKSHYPFEELAVSSGLRKDFYSFEKKHRKASRKGFSRVADMQKQRLMMKHLADRMETSCILARERGIEYAYPLLDVRLVRFVYSLPEAYKNSHGSGRYLMRRALQGKVPEELRVRNNKFGAALPNVFYRLVQDKEEIRALIKRSRAECQYHYVDYKVLEEQLDRLSDMDAVAELKIGPRIFFSTLSLLMLQQLKREGILDSGIQT